MLTTFGDRLKLLIKETGLEQQEVAALLGMKIPTFNGYVGNKREPCFSVLMQIARFFGVTVDYLIGHSDIRNPYLLHLSEDLRLFINDPENKMYLEVARDIKAKTGKYGNITSRGVR